MPLKSLLTAFLLVFLAELGDKTQLATMLLVARGHSARLVFLGAAAALLLSTLVGVLAGTWLAKAVPSHILKTAAGAAFIFIGVLLLCGRI